MGILTKVATSGYVGLKDIADNIAPNRDFSSAGDLLMPLQFTADRPLLLWLKTIAVLIHNAQA